VLIGAQRNASEPDFDGPRNLLNAARICIAPEARDKGAMIALNNQINAAREVTKSHTSDVETFKSGDFGVLGVADDDRVIFCVPVVISTRVPNGRVLPVYGFKGGGKTLKEAGAVFADSLSPQKARILLMHALQDTSKAEDLQKIFNK
jgi:L-asparaginase/Glu-tRNA(Gln) amidotransferase subunit D